MTRVVVHLAKDASYRIRPEGNVLHLLFSTGGVPPASVSHDNGAKTEATAELGDVRFERKPTSAVSSGKDRIVIAISPVPAYSLDATRQGRVRLSLHGTKVADALLRTLDVGPYHGTLRTITTLKDEKTGDCIIENRLVRRR